MRKRHRSSNATSPTDFTSETEPAAAARRDYGFHAAGRQTTTMIAAAARPVIADNIGRSRVMILSSPAARRSPAAACAPGLAAALVAAALLVGAPARAVIAPRHGGPLPAAYLDAVRRDGSLFQLRHGWVEKAREATRRRREYLRTFRTADVTTLPRALRVAGDFRVPVLLARFSGQATPYPSTDLQTELFDGPWPTGTMKDYFAEVSYGALNVDGSVLDWVQLLQSDIYYEGSSNGLSPGDARTGELIKEVLDADDPLIDFGMFDNDGPDGVPNSGDDDGFVDLVVIVHSDSGGECGGPDVWSHTGDYRLWPVSQQQAYTTADSSASGGFIKIQDYAIQSGRACGGGQIEIGAFCHDIGHGLGLPDLFDKNGGTHGIGQWGIMGRGNWNLPESPAHPTAWSRAELGWVVPTDVGSSNSLETIPEVEANAVALKLGFTDDRFLRSPECAIGGVFSLRCGLDSMESAARGWRGGSGYGNGWDEIIEKSFVYDGSGTASFSYRFAYDLEANYDSAFVTVSVGGTATTLAAYNGTSSGVETFDLTPFLAGAPAPVSYTIAFRVATDGFGSDEDGNNLTTCGALVVDDISVIGGGEAYSTGFESSVDGWFQDPARNPVREYWLVENRQPVGFDANLVNSGLLIWHVDEEVLLSSLGNTGGVADSTVRGLVLEEADGIGHLLQNPGNEGDAGDPFPGSTNNTAFDAFSSPGAVSYSGHPTSISITGIGPSGSVMSAFARAGDPMPTVVGISPGVINNDLDTVTVQVTGSDFRAGATFRLTKPAEADIVPFDVTWRDGGHLSGKINVFSRKGGLWDLEVTNPDGQLFTLTDSLTIVQVVAAQLVSASISIVGAGVEIRFELFDLDPSETLFISRTTSSRASWRRLEGRPEAMGGGVFRYIDGTVNSGRAYDYRIEVVDAVGMTRELYRGRAEVPVRALALNQNAPNPFNPTTTISYYLPSAGRVTLEIFDISGALVRTLFDGVATAGPHRRVWDARDAHGRRVSTGLYIYRLGTERETLSRKMLFLK